MSDQQKPQRCPSCGEWNDVGRGTCWLCMSDISEMWAPKTVVEDVEDVEDVEEATSEKVSADEAGRSEGEAETQRDQEGWTEGEALGVGPAPGRSATDALVAPSVAMTAAVLLVLAGAAVLAPGLGIALAFVLIIPFVRTIAVAKARAAQGAEDPIPTLVPLFFGSMVVTFVVLTIVGVVAFGTFCLTCLGIATANPQVRSINSAIIASGFVTLCVLLPVGAMLFRWIRKRWRRHTTVK